MQQDLRRGALYAVASAAALAVSALCIKAASVQVPNGVIVFLRSLLGLALLTPWLLRRGLSGVRTTQLDGHLWRALFGVVSMYCYFYAISQLSLAEAVLLTYSMPLYVPFIAWVWLGEKPSPMAFPSALLGLVGIGLIVKPGVGGFASVAALIGAFSGFAAASAMVSIRRISKTEPATRIVFYFMLMATLITAAPLPWVWQTPPPASLPLLIGIGVAATLGQWCVTKAYSAAPAAQVGPFTYSAVVFAGLLGWLIWGERPDRWSLLGILLVIGSCLLALIPKPHSPAVDTPLDV
ncbi:MAG: DMT family transporter [Nevskia sp.]